MPLPTQPVTCRFFDQSGNPAAGARVVFRLSVTEVYDGFVAPELVEATADVNGECVVSLFPNALGSNASQYEVKAWNADDGRKILDAYCTVPDSACLLHEIVILEPYPAVDQALQAMLAAQSALSLVTAQRLLAETAAGDAADSASAASTSAGAASTSAASAAASAAAAETSGSAIALRADLATPATGKGDDILATATHTFSKVSEALAAIDWADQKEAARVNLLNFVNPADWEKITNGTALYDCTAAFQSAIDYCKSQQLAPTGTLGAGQLTLVLPRGFIVISNDLVLTGMNGFRIIGAGAQETQIVFTKAYGTLFYYDGYLNIEVSHMSIFEGDVSMSGGKPTWAAHATKTSTCFRFNGASSGTDFEQNGLIIGSFALVYRTKDGVVNCDNHVHNHCRYYTNSLIWDNTNPNAVLWSFNECKAYYNANVFLNPGSTLRVNGGDWINPGDFLTGSLASMTTDIVFDGLRFESYQNIDPTSNPRLMVLSGTHNITFRNCTQRGGGSLTGKTSATLNGLYNIKVQRCWFPGDWQATVGSSQDGITSSIIFEECDGVPNVVQTLVGGQGSRPLNLEYRRHRQSTTGYVDRLFHGALSSQNRAITDTTARDMYRFEAVLNASSTSKNCPVFVVSPYIMQFVGAEIEFWTNGVNTVVIDVWTDSTKTTKLGTVTTAVAQNLYQHLEIPLSGVLARYQITSASNPLYVELTAASNAGTCRANVTLKYRQVN